MKMSGMPGWLQWLGWMLNSLILGMITISIMTFMLTCPMLGPMDQCNVILFWLVQFLYVLWVTTFCFLVSSLFERPIIATTVGIILWLVGFFVGSTVSQKSPSFTSDALFILFCPNAGLFYAWMYLLHLEYDGQATWKNIGLKVEGAMSLGHVMGLILLSSLINMILAATFESIIPTKYGVSTCLTWSCFGQRKSKKITPAESDDVVDNSKSFEAEPQNLPVGLEVVKLCKTFVGGKKAVNNVSMRAYSGQIFCLLGHNGAGKTTTMSILTGMMSPTSGTAMIGGKDMRTQMGSIRQSLGLCPQHDLFFADLTVAEHLNFFGRLKGWSSSEAKSQVPLLLAKLNLKDKANVIVKKLSGGQKRRVSLGIAISGNSQVLFLDECSSGLDPEARRHIWDLLLELRNEKTIILTTHYMEEADILGDRIAIMANGTIQCCGSPTFLKKFYGTGYSLSLGLISAAHVPAVVKLVQHNIPSAFVKSQEQKGAEFELHVAIPTLENNPTSRFPTLFAQLLDGKEALGIVDLGLTSTSLDEVFVRVDEVQHSGEVKNTFPELPEGSKAKGMRLACQQFLGLVIKKMLYTLKRWKMELILMAFALALLAGAVAMFRTESNDRPRPTLVEIVKTPKGTVFYALADDDDISKERRMKSLFVKTKVGNSHQEASSQALELERKKDSYSKDRILGANISSKYLIANYAAWVEHSLPLSANLMTNSILASLTSGNHKISVSHHPLPPPPFFPSLGDFNRNFDFLDTAFAAIVSIGLAIIVTSRLIHPTEERISQVKHLQRMTGVGPLKYWSSMLLCDTLLTLVLTILMIVVIYSVETYGVISNHGGSMTFLFIVAIYFCGGTLISYLFSLMARTAASGFGLVILLHLMGGILMAIMAPSFIRSKEVGLYAAGEVMTWVGRPILTFGLFTSLKQLTAMTSTNSYCETVKAVSVKYRLCERSDSAGSHAILGVQSCCDKCASLPRVECFKYYSTYLAWADKGVNSETPGIGQELFFMILFSILHLIILLLIEYAHFAKCSTNIKFDRCVEDSDVNAEMERVERQLAGPLDAANVDALVVDSLCKSYGPFVAVNNVTFGVENGECFGLLGVNGAGKTTTFKILTGQENATSGTARILATIDLDKDANKFISQIGYCPQMDALLGVLTGSQMLSLFGRLRGVKALGPTVKGWLDRFGLSESAHVQCGKYSGGMKRRLCAAMALIGDPPIILLDEPTSGVDPVSRRKFWDTITILKQTGSSSIVLTTHSMEECEYLCSRLGIMVNGELQCLGRVQHLKDKFAKGYSLTLRLRTAADGGGKDDHRPSQQHDEGEKRGTTMAEPEKNEGSMQQSTDVENSHMDETNPHPHSEVEPQKSKRIANKGLKPPLRRGSKGATHPPSNTKTPGGALMPERSHTSIAGVKNSPSHKRRSSEVTKEEKSETMSAEVHHPEETEAPKNSLVKGSDPRSSEAVVKTPKSDTENAVEALIQKIVSQFSPCSLKDHHQNNLQFHLEDASIRLDEVFRKIEAIKRSSGNLIEDYSVQQTTLEELFLGFARNQYPVRKIPISRCMKILTCACGCC